MRLAGRDCQASRKVDTGTHSVRQGGRESLAWRQAGRTWHVGRQAEAGWLAVKQAENGRQA
jgi:hypothetical protein